jgi:hypothetical protein
MEIEQLLQQGREIWGEKNCDLPQIVIRMGKVFGDICPVEEFGIAKAIKYYSKLLYGTTL